MTVLKRLLLVLLMVVLGFFALNMIASESGEVVVLTTPDEGEGEATTRLWVVDHDGASWLRSGSEGAGWYQRLLAAETVYVERDGAVGSYVATPVVSARAPINDAMAAKYGWADRFIGAVYGRDDAIPIRLSTP